MSDISTTAVTSAGRPTVVSFTTLNCSPRPNMRKMTPICDQVDTSAVSTMLPTQIVVSISNSSAITSTIRCSSVSMRFGYSFRRSGSSTASMFFEFR